MDEIALRIRPVEDGDRGHLLSVSYSKLDLFEQCHLRYKFKYVDGMYSFNPSIATEFGSIAHKVLELKGRDKIEGKDTDYDYLKQVLEDGIEEKTDKGSERLIGTQEISKKYLEQWYQPDNKSGMNYPEKVNLFIDKVLPTRMEDKQWKVLGCEVPFEFVWNYSDDGKDKTKEVIVHGFIDRVDYKQKNLDNTYHDLCVIDYKTSKEVFPESKVKTPMQHFVYSLACYSLYVELPKRHVYDFICLDKTQDSETGEICTRGWHKRAIKKLNKLLNEIDELEKSGVYTPSPSPLCYWCFAPSMDYTPNADPKFAGTCEYYSLWTPENRVFTKNKEWDSNDASKNSKGSNNIFDCSDSESIGSTDSTNQKPTPRKLIF